jgi:hypothetical protein
MNKDVDMNKSYPDYETNHLIEVVAKMSERTVPDQWEAYGAYLIEYTMMMGWDELLRSLSGNLRVRAVRTMCVHMPNRVFWTISTRCTTSLIMSSTAAAI